jgi:uncharacterized protein
MQKHSETQKQILKHYQALGDYCDRFFANVKKAYGAEMKCGRGCCACCTLETVAPIEAEAIKEYCLSGNIKAEGAKEGCVFLKDGECAIYPVRPIICRTHGLPMIFGTREIDVCPLNFTTMPHAEIRTALVLDAAKIADNLMRLNLAWCMAAGSAEKAGDRVVLG